MNFHGGVEVGGNEDEGEGDEFAWIPVEDEGEEFPLFPVEDEGEELRRIPVEVGEGEEVLRSPEENVEELFKSPVDDGRDVFGRNP